ncbi:MAG: DUF433 domain-containing protein [Methylotetracoccus sp.]|jgi:uncharacterized protein (DUF433 family)|nr:DUF433 domain-containing protein [Methylotetracoccus sp.]
MIDLNEFIAIDPDIRGGKPCIKGTRITVYDILEYMAGGMSETEILADFPSLKPEHLRAVLAFAAQRERRLTMGAPHEIAASREIGFPVPHTTGWRTMTHESRFGR